MSAELQSAAVPAAASVASNGTVTSPPVLSFAFCKRHGVLVQRIATTHNIEVRLRTDLGEKSLDLLNAGRQAVLDGAEIAARARDQPERMRRFARCGHHRACLPDTAA